jgi:hypothetical protein
MAFPKSAVSIPIARASVAAVKDLDEADASFDHPPGGEAYLPEGARLRPVEAVQSLRRLGLARLKPHDLRHCHLHAEGQLVRLDARPDRGVCGILDRIEAIELIDDLCSNKGPETGAGRRERSHALALRGVADLPYPGRDLRVRVPASIGVEEAAFPALRLIDPSGRRLLTLPVACEAAAAIP